MDRGRELMDDNFWVVGVVQKPASQVAQAEARGAGTSAQAADGAEAALRDGGKPGLRGLAWSKLAAAGRRAPRRPPAPRRGQL